MNQSLADVSFVALCTVPMKSWCSCIVSNFEVCHPRCVNSVTNLIMYCTYSHNTTIFSVSDIQLHWVQLYNKRGILGGVGGGQYFQ